MDLLKTRQLGIEFERRLQTISPAFIIQNKLDTETIYSFINEAQKQLFDTLYTASITEEIPAERLRQILSTLRVFRREEVLNLDEIIDYVNIYDLPENMYIYDKSVSRITNGYNGSANNKVTNQLIKYDDFNELADFYFNQHCIIRRPFVALYGNQLYLCHDEYTTVNDIILQYYIKPQDIDLFANSPILCEFPDSMFNEIVEQAVQLYLNYVQGPTRSTEKKESSNDKKTE